MKFPGRRWENSAATKTSTSLRIERRVLTTPSCTVAIANIATVSVGTHVKPKPRLWYWIFVAGFVAMAWASMRPDFTWGPLTPTGISYVLILLALSFAALALRPDDKTAYLLVTSSDGTLSRFPCSDRTLLEEVRSILTDKINRADDSMVFNIDFDAAQIEPLTPAVASVGQIGSGPGQSAGQGPATGDRNASLARARSASPETSAPSGRQTPGQPGFGPSTNGAGSGKAEKFVDFSSALPAIVEMHRFYARQPGTQHLEQRLSELELLMRAGTPTVAQKSRLRELAGEMSQILGAYPQAVELFDHVGRLAA